MYQSVPVGRYVISDNMLYLQMMLAALLAVVCLASPSAPSVQLSAPSLVDDIILQLQQTVNIQALAIQGLINTLQSSMSVAKAARCATNDVVRSVVHGAIAPQHTVSQLTTHCDCDCEEQLAGAVAPLQMTIGNLTQYLQLQNHKNRMLADTILNMNETITRLTPPPTNCGQSSDYRLNYETGSCYKWHKERQQWPRANESCVLEGAQLTVINGASEARILGDWLKEKADGYYAAQVGYQRDDDGVWRAVTGESLGVSGVYNPWHENQPDDQEHRRYAAMWGDGTIINVGNESSLPFICEKKPAYFY